MNSETNYAVLSGDIIQSAKYSGHERETLFELMNRAGEEIHTLYPYLIPLKIDIFRGDSWQLLVSSPIKAIRIALLYRCYLKGNSREKTDTRIAIGCGPIDFLPTERVSQGDGPAFHLSGKALEGMKDTFMRFVYADREDTILIDQVCRLLDVIVSSWTAKQAQAVFGALQNLTQKEIASSWKETVSQQNIAKHLKFAHWKNVSQTLNMLEKYLQQNN